MTDTEPAFATDASDVPRVTEYRAISLLAVLSLILGMASALAFAGPVFMFLPGFTVLVSVMALRAISDSEGALLGRKLVLWGLALAAFFTSASIAHQITRRELAIRDARQLAETFLALLQANQPQKAHQLQYLESKRQPPNTSLWRHYRTSSQDYEGLVKFVEAPVIRTLLALGDKADIKYFDTEEMVESNDRMYLSLLYSVTYKEQGKPHTFFVRIAMRRDDELNSGILDWSVDNYSGGVRPYVPYDE